MTRAAENTIWFASCNAAYDPHQNCRSLVIAPDGRIQAQSELKREELVVADIDIGLATRAMYRFDVGDDATDDTAPLLFAATVVLAQRREHQIKVTPLHRIGHPDEVAETIHWLTASASMMTGAIVELDFGLHLNAV